MKHNGRQLFFTCMVWGSFLGMLLLTYTEGSAASNANMAKPGSVAVQEDKTPASNPEGDKIVAAVSDFIYSGRKISFSTATVHKGETYYGQGYLTATADRGFVFIEGVSETYYDQNSITTHDIANNQLVLQTRKAGAENNPFALLSLSNKGVASSAPQIIGGQNYTAVTVKPLGKTYYKEARIYVKQNGLESALYMMDITLKSGDTLKITVTNYTSPQPELLDKCILSPEKLPSAEVVDLR